MDPFRIIEFILGVGGCIVMYIGVSWGDLTKGVKKYCKEEVRATYHGMESVVNKKLYGKKPVDLPVVRFSANEKDYEVPAVYVSGALPKLSEGDELTVRYDPEMPEYCYVIGEGKDNRMVYPPIMVWVGAIVAVAVVLISIAVDVLVKGVPLF